MYDERYDDGKIRGGKSAFIGYVRPFLSAGMQMADFGCGTCRKVMQYAPLVGSVDAVDRSERMLHRAAQSLEQNGIENVRLFQGDNLNTPFPSHSYDVCTVSLSAWSAAEAHRLLKPQGCFFIEALLPDDKGEIKRAFGEDALGARGYLYGQTVEERMMYLEKSVRAFFSIEDISFFEQKTTLSEQGFLELLALTPTIRGFDEKADESVLKDLIQNGEVTFTERRVFLRALAKTQAGGSL